jgi:hypothetical protein
MGIRGQRGQIICKTTNCGYRIEGSLTRRGKKHNLCQIESNEIIFVSNLTSMYNFYVDRWLAFHIMLKGSCKALKRFSKGSWKAPKGLSKCKYVLKGPYNTQNALNDLLKICRKIVFKGTWTNLKRTLKQILTCTRKAPKGPFSKISGSRTSLERLLKHN